MYRKVYNSPIGKIFMESDGEYLTGVWFEKSKAEHKDKFEEAGLKIFDETEKWLSEYFSGKNPSFTPKYKVIGASEFRKRVLEILLTIPYGKTVTYNDIASQIARGRGITKMSAQAVGGAVGWNPICIIIPCHRVVGKNGNLVGFGGGIENKISLLKVEGHDISKFSLPKK